MFKCHAFKHNRKFFKTLDFTEVKKTVMYQQKTLGKWESKPQRDRKYL